MIIKLQVDREKEEGQGEGGLVPSCSGASGSRMGPGPDSGSSAPSSVPQSLATSRDDEDDDDEESSGRRSNGHGSRLVILDTSLHPDSFAIITLILTLKCTYANQFFDAFSFMKFELKTRGSAQK